MQKKKSIFCFGGGYLSAKGIKLIEMKCNIEIYADEYNSNLEFLRKWDEKPKSYELVIFSNTIFNSIKQKLNHSSIPNLIKTPTIHLLSKK